VNPAILNLAPFSFDLDAGSPTMTIPGALIQDAGKVRRQRIELTYQELGSFTAADGPLPADAASFDSGGAGTALAFTGDIDNPSFSTNAKIRLFLRRPFICIIYP